MDMFWKYPAFVGGAAGAVLATLVAARWDPVESAAADSTAATAAASGATRKGSQSRRPPPFPGNFTRPHPEGEPMGTVSFDNIAVDDGAIRASAKH